MPNPTTLFGICRPLIVHSDAHHVQRQTADISHEFDHAPLTHEPAPLASGGMRSFDQKQEDETYWLG